MEPLLAGPRRRRGDRARRPPACPSPARGAVGDRLPRRHRRREHGLDGAWRGHRGAAGVLHLAADIAHLLAAAVWIGALAFSWPCPAAAGATARRRLFSTPPWRAFPASGRAWSRCWSPRV
ncbi:hypothetical protein ACRAWD_20730 [Caulobacter segnis]